MTATRTWAITAGAIAKRWSLRALAVSWLIVVALRHGVGGLVAVPGRQGVESLIWPLAGGLEAVFVAAVAGAIHEIPEIAAARPGWTQRAAFALLTALAVLLGAILGGPTLGFAVRIRNDLGLFGLALGSATLLPRAAAWVPPAVVVVVIWFFGPASTGRPPNTWAVLLQPDTATTPLAVAAATFTLGVLIYIVGLSDHPRARLLGI